MLIEDNLIPTTPHDIYTIGLGGSLSLGVGPIVLFRCLGVGPIVLFRCLGVGPIFLFRCLGVGPIFLFRCLGVGPIFLFLPCANTLRRNLWFYRSSLL